MVDDSLGHNPLGEELDSIWKIPKRTASPLASPPLQTDTAPPAENETEAVAREVKEPSEWGPIEETGDVPATSDATPEATPVEALPITAEKEDTPEQLEESLQLVGCRLEDELYGIDIVGIQEIIRLQEVTRIPKTEGFVHGVVNLRGKIIPIVSLRERLGFNKPDIETKESRIVIVTSQYGGIGLKVDAVTEVFRVPKSVIGPPLPSSKHFESEYIEGVGKLEDKLIVILNTEKLLSVKEEQQQA